MAHWSAAHFYKEAWLAHSFVHSCTDCLGQRSLVEIEWAVNLKYWFSSFLQESIISIYTMLLCEYAALVRCISFSDTKNISTVNMLRLALGEHTIEQWITGYACYVLQSGLTNVGMHIIFNFAMSLRIDLSQISEYVAWYTSVCLICILLDSKKLDFLLYTLVFLIGSWVRFLVKLQTF